MNYSHNEKHVAESLDRIRVVFEKASTVIEGLKVGEKITATGLAAQLAEEIGMKGPSLYPTLKWLYEGYPCFKITRGARGGIERVSYSEDNSDTVENAPVEARSSDTQPSNEAD